MEGESSGLCSLKAQIGEKFQNQDIFYSFELFPTQHDNDSHTRFFREIKNECQPSFYALAWGTDQKTIGNDFLAMKNIGSFPASQTFLHLAASGLTKNQIDDILFNCLEKGISNVILLRGSGESGYFLHASDLVAHVREKFGQKFCIGVAGYPEQHPESINKEEDLKFLKQKVDAGGDLVITQFFFEFQVFVDFVKDCRAIGIKVPIIPGILVFSDVETLFRMTARCAVKIPPSLVNRLAELKKHGQDVAEFAKNFNVQLIQNILKNGSSYGIHFFTLNRSQPVIEIIRGLKLQSFKEAHD